MNKKGNIKWILVFLLILVALSAIRHSMIYPPLSEYKQENLAHADGTEAQYQQQKEKQEPQNSSSGYIELMQCTDSDGGKDYYTKGYITRSNGTKEYDKCSSGAYKDHVWEHYCTPKGCGSTNYKCPYGCSDGACDPEPPKITLSYVFDGDTVKLSNGKKVRLIGINAPESGEVCSSEATNKLKELVLGKKITLEKDIEDRDQYGRSLRYLYADGIFVNLEMVRSGVAHSYRYGLNTKYSAKFDQAENEAKQNEGCLWKTSQKKYIKDQCIYITNFHFNAAGNDNYNLNDEYVVLRNKCPYSIRMTGWTAKDETTAPVYTFPQFTFQERTTLTLYTGSGTDTDSALYWGRIPGNYAAIWNNNGDTLFLRDSEGDLILTQSYP